MRNKLISILKITLTSLLIAWIGGAIYIYSTGEKRIFFPERQEEINFTSNFEQYYKTDSSGKKIGIQFYPKSGSENVIIYFHGNYGRLQRVLEPLTEFANVVSPSLQGYAESEGTPNYYNVFEVADLTIFSLF